MVMNQQPEEKGTNRMTEATKEKRRFNGNHTEKTGAEPKEQKLPGGADYVCGAEDASVEGNIGHSQGGMGSQSGQR